MTSASDLKAQMKAAMTALKASGAQPTGVIVHPNGGFTVLTGQPSPPSMPAANDGDDWLGDVGDVKSKRPKAFRTAGNA